MKISSIPRGTNHMESISNYLVGYARDKGFDVYQDSHYNVLIKKKASLGYEEKDPINKLTELYVRFHDEAENNKELEDEAREAFRKMEW